MRRPLPSAVPELPGPPIWGHLSAFRRDPMALLERVRERCGDVGIFRLGPRAVVVISDAEIARQVLVDQADALEKGPVVRRLARALLGDGLIAIDTARHRARRSLVAPAFARRHAEGHAAAIATATAAWAAALQDNDVLDAREEMLKLALRVAGRALFSADLDGKERALGEAVDTLLRHVAAGIERPLRLPLAFPTAHNRRVRRAMARLDETLLAMIAARRASARSAVRGADDDGDVLDTLVGMRDAAGQGLSDREVRDEAMNLFLASHETTGSALAWTLWLLARHPDAQRRVQADLDGETPAPPVSAPAPVPYSAQVFQEALRLYPPVHSLGREARLPIAVGPYSLPAGTILVVSTWLMHRRADYFPDPTRFDPARFSVEGADARAALPGARHAYLPFGLGPRACLGAQFAITLARSTVSSLLRRFTIEVTSDDEVRPEMLVTLRPRDPVRLRLRKKFWGSFTLHSSA